MATYVGTIDTLIKMIEEFKKQGYKYFVASPDLEGGQFSPSKRNKNYRMRFAISGKVFVKEDLKILLFNPKMAVFLFRDNSEFSEEAKKIIEESLAQQVLEE